MRRSAPSGGGGGEERSGFSLRGENDSIRNGSREGVPA